MPELPDVEVYVLHLRRRIVGAALERVRVASPFLVRSYAPPLASAFGRRVESVRRVGKRIVIDLDGDLHLVLHLMIAGRLRWRSPQAPLPRRLGLAAFDFPTGALLLTEASTKRRASLHVVEGEHGVAALDPGGVEPLAIDRDAFAAALKAESHTLKRALTDPRIFSGIGNAYSDEILWRARVSPVRLTRAATDDEVTRLYEAVQATLRDWLERLTRQSGDSFPEEVTAFHDAMAVHGRFGQPCPACGAPVQRIAYAENESNYCARCQTGGKLLADRSLSRLMREDWPKTVEDLERRKVDAKLAFDGRGRSHDLSPGSPGASRPRDDALEAAATTARPASETAVQKDASGPPPSPPSGRKKHAAPARGPRPRGS